MGKIDIMKKLAVLLALLLLIPCVSATITLNDPKDIYNLGDKLDLEFEILESEDINGFVKLSLNCDDTSILIFFAPVTIEDGKKISMDHSLPISKSFVNTNDVLGLCYIKAILEDMSVNKIDDTISETFTISDKINLVITLNQGEFLPGQKLKIEGIATLENGREVDGTATITFGKDFTTDVSDSKFDLRLSLNEDIKSGFHEIDISVTDDNGNLGEDNKEISIIPVLTSISVEKNKEIFFPEEELTIKPVLLDQAGDEMEGNSWLAILNPDGNEILNEAIESNEEVGYVFEMGAAPGNWEINLVSDDIEATEVVEMKEYEAVDVKLTEKDGVTYFDAINIGNVYYKKGIIIWFKSEEETIEKTKKLSLAVGESISFKMSAPDGDYEVIIKNEDVEESFSGVSLTGSTIKLTDTTGKERKAIVRNVVIILFLGSFIFIFGMKYFREWKYRKRRESRKKDEHAVHKYIARLKEEELIPKDSEESFDDIGGKEEEENE